MCSKDLAYLHFILFDCIIKIEVQFNEQVVKGCLLVGFILTFSAAGISGSEREFFVQGSGREYHRNKPL